MSVSPRPPMTRGRSRSTGLDIRSPARSPSRLSPDSSHPDLDDGSSVRRGSADARALFGRLNRSGSRSRSKERDREDEVGYDDSSPSPGGRQAKPSRISRSRSGARPRAGSRGRKLRTARSQQTNAAPGQSQDAVVTIEGDVWTPQAESGSQSPRRGQPPVSLDPVMRGSPPRGGGREGRVISRPAGARADGSSWQRRSSDGGVVNLMAHLAREQERTDVEAQQVALRHRAIQLAEQRASGAVGSRDSSSGSDGGSPRRRPSYKDKRPQRILTDEVMGPGVRSSSHAPGALDPSKSMPQRMDSNTSSRSRQRVRETAR